MVVKIAEAMNAAGRGEGSDARSQRMSREASERAVLDLAATAADDDLPAIVRRLRAGGRLTPALLLAAILDGDLRLPAAALAELTSMARRRVDALVAEGRGAGFAALCRKAGLPAPFVPVLEVALRRGAPCWRTNSLPWARPAAAASRPRRSRTPRAWVSTRRAGPWCCCVGWRRRPPARRPGSSPKR